MIESICSAAAAGRSQTESMLSDMRTLYVAIIGRCATNIERRTGNVRDYGLCSLHVVLPAEVMDGQ